MSVLLCYNSIDSAVTELFFILKLDLLFIIFKIINKIFTIQLFSFFSSLSGSAGMPKSLSKYSRWFSFSSTSLAT